MQKNMTNYNKNINTFKVDFNKDGIDKLKNMIDSKDYKYPINEYPVLYILKNEHKVYIGETTDICARLTTHIQTPEKKQMTTAYVFSGEYFNQSLV